MLYVSMSLSCSCCQCLCFPAPVPGFQKNKCCRARLLHVWTVGTLQELCFVDFTFCSPDEMMREVAACPSVRTLTDLKDCLDFCSTSWVQLFCRLGGAALLLQVLVAACCHFAQMLLMTERTVLPTMIAMTFLWPTCCAHFRWCSHVPGKLAGLSRSLNAKCVQALEVLAESSEDDEGWGGSGEAAETLLVTLQCLHALMSGGAGMAGVLQVQVLYSTLYWKMNACTYSHKRYKVCCSACLFCVHGGQPARISVCA